MFVTGWQTPTSTKVQEMHTAGIRQLRATHIPVFTTHLSFEFQISKSLYIAWFRGGCVFLTGQKQLKSGNWEKIFEFKPERIQTNTHNFGNWLNYSKNKLHELDVPVKIMVFIRQVFCCSTAVWRYVQISSPCAAPWIYPTGWTSAGTAISEQLVAFQQEAHASSGKHGPSQLWGGPAEWSPPLLYTTAGAKPGLSSSWDFARYSPQLTKPARFIRQTFVTGVKDIP